LFRLTVVFWGSRISDWHYASTSKSIFQLSISEFRFSSRGNRISHHAILPLELTIRKAHISEMFLAVFDIKCRNCWCKAVNGNWVDLSHVCRCTRLYRLRQQSLNNCWWILSGPYGFEPSLEILSDLLSKVYFYCPRLKRND